MAERTYVVQKVQLGVETTPGVAVPANRRMQATSVETEMQVTVQDFTPVGSKYTTVAAEQKEWVQAPIRGYPSYHDMIYLASSVINTPVTTQVMDGSFGTAAYKWTYDSAVTSEDTPKTFTFQQGDPVRAHQFSYGIVKELGLKFSRTSVEVSGSILGQAVLDGITLTAAPTDITLIPMLATGFDLFIDPTFAALGTTKIGRLFDGHFVINNRYGALWLVDSSQSSFTGAVELKPAVTFVVIVEADSNGMSYLQTLRKGSTVFGRIRNLSLTTTGMNINGPAAAAARVDPVTSVAAGTLGTLLDASLAATDVGRLVTNLSPNMAAPPVTLTAVTPGVSGTMSTPATAAIAASPSTIGTNIPYSFTLDLALKVNHLGRFSDQEGVYAIEFGFIDVADSAWGKSMHLEVVGSMSTL